MVAARAIALALLAGAAFAGCAALRPHALDYVVLRDHQAQGEVEVPRAAAAVQAEARPEYPIFGDDPPPLAQALQGAGGAGCSVGLAGARCELGILAAEVPLEDRELLPPDGRAIQAPLPGPGDEGRPPPLPPTPRPEGPIRPTD